MDDFAGFLWADTNFPMQYMKPAFQLSNAPLHNTACPLVYSENILPYNCKMLAAIHLKSHTGYNKFISYILTSIDMGLINNYTVF